MSAVLLFALGAVVTALVAVGVALPIYGAILDGRYQAEHEGAELHELPANRATGRPAA
jgi:hypothetical protein